MNNLIVARITVHAVGMFGGMTHAMGRHRNSRKLRIIGGSMIGAAMGAAIVIDIQSKAMRTQSIKELSL